MQRKIFTILLSFCLLTWGFGQKRSSKSRRAKTVKTVKKATAQNKTPAPIVYSAAELLNSNDMQAIAKYLLANPNDPMANALKLHLIDLLDGKTTKTAVANTASSQAGTSNNVAVNDLTPATKQALTRQQLAVRKTLNRPETPEERILNHILAPDPMDPNRLLTINNVSQCAITLSVKGRDSAEMSIPKGDKKRVLLLAGLYKISGNICGTNHEYSINLKDDTKMNVPN